MAPGHASTRSTATVEGIVEAVTYLFTRPQYDPPRVPQVALQAYSFGRGDHDGAASVVELLQRDPALAAGVMRAAELRAPARWRATSIEDVMARCGVRGIANLALEVGSLRIFAGAPSYRAEMRACREHAVRCAHTAAILAGETSVDSEPAFMAGLLHDVGVVVGLIALADWRLFPTPLPYEEVAGALYEAHERIGGIVADAWHLPRDVRAAIADHHAPRTVLGAIVEATDRQCSPGLRVAKVTTCRRP